MNRKSVRMNGEFAFIRCNEITRTNYLTVIEELRDEFPVTRSSDSYFPEDLMDHGIQLELYYILEKALEAESMCDGCTGPIMSLVIDGEEDKFKLSIREPLRLNVAFRSAQTELQSKSAIWTVLPANLGMRYFYVYPYSKNLEPKQ